MLSPLKLNKNSISIIENIIKNGKISQNEIANQTNINRSIVSKEIPMLEKLKLIKIKNVKNKKFISFNHKFANTILIEIDRYFIHGFLNTSLGYSIKKKSIETDILEVSDLFKNVEEIIDEFIKVSKVPVIGIGIAVHGIVEHNHMISYAPNTKWNNLNLKSVFEEKYDIFTTIINVANVSAITENIISPNPNLSLASVSVHSGVGAGLILKNKLYTGSNGRSLEIGHLNIKGDSKKCDCGGTGCLETEISYPRIIDKMTDLNIKNPSIETFINLYKKGNKDIIKLYEEYIELLSIGISNLYLIIDPDILKINCEIFRSIPKSVEILKSKIHSSIINQTNITISKLNSSTRCLGLSVEITRYFLGLDFINIYTQRSKFIDSYNKKNH